MLKAGTHHRVAVHREPAVSRVTQIGRAHPRSRCFGTPQRGADSPRLDGHCIRADGLSGIAHPVRERAVALLPSRSNRHTLLR